jgi:DNA (cytosine-5)-methyltransferase 1
MWVRKMEKKRLRVFEAFAGIGAQATALERIGIDYEVVGISDWFTDAIICYDAIHCKDEPIPELPSKEEQIEYLHNFEFSKDSVHPSNIDKLDTEYLEKLYIANKRTKNMGSITKLKAADMPECDLLVYSFPCQDLSTGGKGLGMKKGSGTRSGLLWEIERILSELNEEDRLPEYLLLENVKTIMSKSNEVDLKEWLSFLEKLGYVNDACMILNALDFAVPQDRERAFIVSHLGSKLNVMDDIQFKERKYEFKRFFRNDYKIQKYKNEADIAQLNRTPSREQMWKINGRELNENTTVRTITCNMDRTHCAALFPYNGAKGNTYRRPTIREAFLLMGFTDEEYERTEYLDFSYRKMNKLIGNAIVVDVLVAIFRAMFKEEEWLYD